MPTGQSLVFICPEPVFSDSEVLAFPWGLLLLLLSCELFFPLWFSLHCHFLCHLRRSPAKTTRLGCVPTEGANEDQGQSHAPPPPSAGRSPSQNSVTSLIVYLFIYVSGCARSSWWLAGILHWENGVLAAGPPGKHGAQLFRQAYKFQSENMSSTVVQRRGTEVTGVTSCCRSF